MIQGSTTRYLMIIGLSLAVYLALVVCFSAMWRLTSSIGTLVSVSISFLLDFILLVLGARILWDFAERLSNER